MRIHRLAVTNWRGLDCELADLAPGLNLIFGPNESGKSRLVEALRFALFESSSGRATHKRALETWGIAPGKPRVLVEFELAGTRWRLEKEFLGTGHNTRLRSETVALEGEEAEARLAELLGVGTGGRSELKPEDRGIWSLLWVDQGGSREPPAHNEVSQSRLQDRLTREIGEVAAGELGQRLLRRAEEVRARFYTTSRDAEKSTLTEPREHLTQLRQRLADAVARRDAVAADAEELGRQQARERDLVGRVAEAEQRLEQARRRHQQADELDRRRALCEEQVRAAESRRDQCRQALDNARALAAEITRLSDAVHQAAADQGAAEAARQAAQADCDEASRAAAAADQACATKEQEVVALRRRRELEALREQADRLRGRLEEARRASERLTALREELSQLPRVTPREVERLRSVQRERDAARARLEGASASLELEARRDLTVMAETLAAGSRKRVLVEDEQRLEVDGVVGITVRPGGGELPRLKDAVSDAERAMARLLESLGVADLAEAERCAVRRRDLDAELERSRGELERLLPEGREAAEARWHELETQRQGLAESEPEPAPPEALETAESELRELVRRRDELRARRELAQERLAAARETAASARTDRDSRQRQLDEAVARREAAADTAALDRALAEAERQWRERVAVRDEVNARFEALGGEQVALDLEQASRAAGQLEEDLQSTRHTCLKLQTRLEAAGDDGRHEQVQELEAEVLRAEAALTRVTAQAAAAKRLHEVLLEEYESARERLAQPVIARIRPYLRSLFPDTEVWLDEDLNLKGLRTAETDQHFEALSGGAREQLSLLVRIGLAEVIGADESWPLVLDDVLVNTDADRIQRVQRLLFQASRHMQMLLFTCHGPLFDGLGADRRIELPAPERRTGSLADQASAG